jgi:23S rRNA (uracil1939-C5)-methyltransferase
MAQETPDFDWDAAAALMPRVAPPCPYYGSCGGCRLQQYRYEDQVALKERRLQTLFTAAGITPESWLAPITGQPFGYRTRLRFSVKYVPKKGGVLVGFHERKKTFIMDMDSCRIVPEKVSASLPLLKECLADGPTPGPCPRSRCPRPTRATAIASGCWTP